jgi:hypothetical protein
MSEDLPQLLERERQLLSALERLGAPPDEIEVLRGDEQLLKILAEDPGASPELRQVMGWHRDRLRRVLAQLPAEEGP